MRYILEQKKLIQKFLFKNGYKWSGIFMKDQVTGDHVVELSTLKQRFVAQLFVNDLEFKIYKKELQPGKCVVTTIADLSQRWIRYQASSGAKRANELLEIVEDETEEGVFGKHLFAVYYLGEEGPQQLFDGWGGSGYCLMENGDILFFFCRKGNYLF